MKPNKSLRKMKGKNGILLSFSILFTILRLLDQKVKRKEEFLKTN